MFQAAFLVPGLMNDHYKTEHFNELTSTTTGAMAEEDSKSSGEGDANNNSTVEKGRGGAAVRERTKRGRTCPKPGKLRRQYSLFGSL